MASDVQSSNTVLLVRPASFGFHAEAAASNVFAASSHDPETSSRALAEFDDLARRLADSGIEILFLDDEPEPPRPDAIFPNNWVTFHADGTVVLYPMATQARRLERNIDGLRALLAAAGFEVRRIVDLSFHERNGRFLEGTGSLVLDRPGRRAFANLSPRTDAHVIADFDDRLDYSTLVFDAHDRSGRPIYHTNVMMSFGARFAVLCPDTLSDEYLAVLVNEIEGSGRQVIEVDYEQLRQFACNLIELKGPGGPIIALSSTARRSYRPDQLRALESFGELVDTDIPTIETVGGGSVRCMITDIHLPRSSQAL
jgi:hypothetical protein